jgi:L-ascorbate metabolism protein UlaG (beta-lactamase superfamily)
MLDKISWLGHSSIKIKTDKVIYIDPWKLRDKEKADLILISHSHGDHLSPSDVKEIQKDETVIITTADCVSQLSGNIKTVKPGDVVHVYDIKVEAVPSYNISKTFHPAVNGWVGFVITLAGKRIYYAGDTDSVPELKNIKADIMIMPVGGTYTMTAEEAAQAVNLVHPEAAIPIHWGDIVGSAADADKFKRLCQAPVVIKSIA